MNICMLKDHMTQHACVCVWVGETRTMCCISFLRPPGSNTPKWFKFDDGEVTETKIDDEEVQGLYYVCVHVFLYTVWVCVCGPSAIIPHVTSPGVPIPVFWWWLHWWSIWPRAKEVSNKHGPFWIKLTAVERISSVVLQWYTQAPQAFIACSMKSGKAWEILKCM